MKKEINLKQDTIVNLEKENKKLSQSRQSEAQINKELQNSLNNLEKELTTLLDQDALTKSFQEKNKALVTEKELLMEDFIRIELKLTKLKSKVANDNSLLINTNHNDSLTKRSANWLRKSAFLSLDELTGFVERVLCEKKDSERDRVEDKETIQVQHDHINELSLENDSLRNDLLDAQEQLAQFSNELDELLARNRDLEAKNNQLAAQRHEQLLAQDLADKISFLEDSLRKKTSACKIQEFKLSRLKHHIDDEQLFFYIENWAAAQSEADSLEERQINLELALSKNPDNRGEKIELELQETRNSLSRLEQRKAELEERIRAIENNNRLKLKNYEKMEGELKQVC